MEHRAEFIKTRFRKMTRLSAIWFPGMIKGVFHVVHRF
jgi:hypothetical protein